MGQRLGHVERAVTDVVAAFAVSFHGMAASVGEWVRHARLAGPDDASDPFDRDGYDWDADPDWEFRTATAMDPEVLRQRYRDACERSRQAAASAASLDQLSAFKGNDGWQFTLRWVLLHLIEETARHAGHADLLREAIDGSIGE